jgi:hypothetical protein
MLHFYNIHLARLITRAQSKSGYELSRLRDGRVTQRP